MKALVAEIYKDHCIVITSDGRFVRQDMPAGAYEIGDEIIVEAAELSAGRGKPVKKTFGMFAKLAAGFAAIVFLVSVSFLGIKYAGAGFAFSPVMNATQTAQAKIADSSGPENTDGVYQTQEKGEEQSFAAEAPASESGVSGSQSLESSADASKSGQASSAANQDSSQSEDALATQDCGAAAASGTNNEEDISMAPVTVLFEGTFKLEKNNIDVLIDYPDLLVTYKLGQLYAQDSINGEIATFTIKIKNLQKSTFNGNIDIIFTGANGSILQTSVIETGVMIFNDAYEQQIPVAADADSFIMTIYGSFGET